MLKELKNLRKRIDKLDFEILQRLVERFSLVQKIARSKAKNLLPVLDKKREERVLRQRKIWAKKLNLDETLIEKIFKLLIKEARLKQKLIIKTTQRIGF